jgi:hypothetical protein
MHISPRIGNASNMFYYNHITLVDPYQTLIKCSFLHLLVGGKKQVSRETSKEEKNTK